MLIFNLTIACVGRVILGMQIAKTPFRLSDLNAQAVNININTPNKIFWTLERLSKFI